MASAEFDTSKLRGMSFEELAVKELELRDEIWKLRLQRSTGQLQDYRKVHRTRRNLARVLTIQNEIAARGSKS